MPNRYPQKFAAEFREKVGLISVTGVKRQFVSAELRTLCRTGRGPGFCNAHVSLLNLSVWLERIHSLLSLNKPLNVWQEQRVLCLQDEHLEMYIKP